MISINLRLAAPTHGAPYRACVANHAQNFVTIKQPIMKQENDNTEINSEEEITDPYQTIAHLFTAADVPSYRKIIKQAIKAACSDRVWTKRDPSSLLWFFDLLESAINAAYLINKDKKKSPFSISREDLFNPDLYSSKQSNAPDWESFPRTLSVKEFIDPYLVFKRFFRYHSLSEWKMELDDIRCYALGKDSFYDSSIDFDALRIYLHLTKLIEAAHLIDVREVTHVDGRIKPKVSAKP